MLKSRRKILARIEIVALSVKKRERNRCKTGIKQTNKTTTQPGEQMEKVREAESSIKQFVARTPGRMSDIPLMRTDPHLNCRLVLGTEE